MGFKTKKRIKTIIFAIIVTYSILGIVVLYFWTKEKAALSNLNNKQKLLKTILENNEIKGDLNLLNNTNNLIIQLFESCKKTDADDSNQDYRYLLKKITDSVGILADINIKINDSAFINSIQSFRTGENQNELLEQTDAKFKAKLARNQNSLYPYLYYDNAQPQIAFFTSIYCENQNAATICYMLKKNYLHKKLLSLDIENNAKTYIVYNNKIIASSENSIINENTTTDTFDTTLLTKIAETSVNPTNTFLRLYDNKSQCNMLYTIAPLPISNLQTCLLIAATPVKYSHIGELLNIEGIIDIFVISCILLLILIYFMSTIITKPLNKVSTVLEQLVDENIEQTDKTKTIRNDEFGDVYSQIYMLKDKINATMSFLAELGKENVDFESNKTIFNRHIDKILNKLKNKLSHHISLNKEQEVIEQQRETNSQCMAYFGELLRKNNENLIRISEMIASEICKYLNKPQCAVFIQTEETSIKKLALMSVFAYGFNKDINIEFSFGEGPIGRAAQEKRTIFINNLPHNYSIIKPDLQHETYPQFAIIVPLVDVNKTIGVIEILSYNNFEQQEMTFLQNLSNLLASTINKTRASINTTKLLQKSQRQKETLSQQEEEMRQNIEELLATHEELERRKAEFKNVFDSIYENKMIAMFSLEGTVLKASKKLLSILELLEEQVIGKDFDILFTNDPTSKLQIKQQWEHILRRDTYKNIRTIKKIKQTYYLSETYIAVSNYENKIDTIIMVAYDITDRVLCDQEITTLVNEIEEQMKK